VSLHDEVPSLALPRMRGRVGVGISRKRVSEWFLVALALATSILSVLAHAEPAPTMVRIGWLSPSMFISPAQGLREGLHDLGYVEGKNLQLERKLADSNQALQSGAAELVSSKVDLIVAFGTPAAQAVLSATSTIPVVFISGDPVGSGLAKSLARPGANGTGISTLSAELVSKRIELLRQIKPTTRRVALLENPSSPLHGTISREARNAAQKLGIQIITLEASNEQELNSAISSLRRVSADALTVSPETFFLANKAKIAGAVAKARLPAIFPWRDFHDANVLMSYGGNPKDFGRHAAPYVDKILKGAKPDDLPIEQISKYELVIDLRVARKLGIKVPQDMLLRADEVIQ